MMEQKTNKLNGRREPLQTKYGKEREKRCWQMKEPLEKTDYLMNVGLWFSFPTAPK